MKLINGNNYEQNGDNNKMQVGDRERWQDTILGKVTIGVFIAIVGGVFIYLLGVN